MCREAWSASTAMLADRRHLVRTALRLSYLTIAWNLSAGGSALAFSIATGSLSLAAFALSALIDVTASLALVWRFQKEVLDPIGAERLEHRAAAAIGVAMMAAALYLSAQGVHALAAATHPETSVAGIVVSSLSVVFLPFLARAKARVAAALGSRALRGDAVLTAASAGLALLALAALVLSRSLGWWWSDATAALAIAVALGAEALRAEIEARRPG